MWRNKKDFGVFGRTPQQPDSTIGTVKRKKRGKGTNWTTKKHPNRRGGDEKAWGRMIREGKTSLFEGGDQKNRKGRCEKGEGGRENSGIVGQALGGQCQTTRWYRGGLQLGQKMGTARRFRGKGDRQKKEEEWHLWKKPEMAGPWGCIKRKGKKKTGGGETENKNVKKKAKGGGVGGIQRWKTRTKKQKRKLGSRCLHTRKKER